MLQLSYSTVNLHSQKFQKNTKTSSPDSILSILRRLSWDELLCLACFTGARTTKLTSAHLRLLQQSTSSPSILNKPIILITRESSATRILVSVGNMARCYSFAMNDADSCRSPHHKENSRRRQTPKPMLPPNPPGRRREFDDDALNSIARPEPPQRDGIKS
jgi:hypothetical protein